MNILAIETSSDVGSVALLCADVLEQEVIAERRAQTSRLLPCVDALLARADIDLRALDAIGFGCGPGSFTGVRIASTIAQGLAMSAGLGVTAVSSLAAIAGRAAGLLGQDRIFVCVDARMGEVYVADYVIREGIAMALEPERLCLPTEVRFPEGSAFAAVGSGLTVHGAAFAAGLARAASVAADLTAEASDLMPAIRSAVAAGALVEPRQAGPRYLRGAAAWKTLGK
jgi:tRNA threonylcarbamoyladenosine biosynthesis protein TsaB